MDLSKISNVELAGLIFLAVLVIWMLKRLGVIDQKTAVLGGLIGILTGILSKSLFQSTSENVADGKGSRGSSQKSGDPREGEAEEYEQKTDRVKRPEEIEDDIDSRDVEGENGSRTLKERVMDVGGRHDDNGSSDAG